MCSSPKSSGRPAPKIRLKGFFEEMAPSQRQRFTEIANQADERRKQRQDARQRWEAKHLKAVPSTGLISWFGKLMATN